MLKFFLVLCVFILAVSCHSADAFQFEEYEWGSSFAFIYSVVKSKSVRLTNKGDHSLEYEDKIYGKTCNVLLMFTPTTKELILVAMQWPFDSVGHSAKRNLIQRYGQPDSEADVAFGGVYVWAIPGTQETIRLDYTGNTTELIYKGGQYSD